VAVPTEGSFVDGDFDGCFMAYSDHHLFWNAANKVRVYAFGGGSGGESEGGRAGIGVPVRVREMNVPFTASGMAVHRPTGTLLLASRFQRDTEDDGDGDDDDDDGERDRRIFAVSMIDIRSASPGDWTFVVETEADRVRFESDVTDVAVDQEHGFVYANELVMQRITQFTTGLRSPAERKAAGGSTTVDLKLTVARVFDCRLLGGRLFMPALTVLSSEELIVHHHARFLSLVHIDSATVDVDTGTGTGAGPDGGYGYGMVSRAQAKTIADLHARAKARRAAAAPGGVGLSLPSLGVSASTSETRDVENTALVQLNADTATANGSVAALRVDERRCYVFAADHMARRVTAHRLDNGLLAAQVTGKSALFGTD
jgi:hypothetical protein